MTVAVLDYPCTMSAAFSAHGSVLDDSTSSGQPRHNLPLQPKAIIGREQELELARQQLLRAEVRLLTLTGPPGVGKTRLAVELGGSVLDAFEAGVRFVDLAPVWDARLVIDAIARGLGQGDIDRRVALEVLETFLRDKSLLLILDNFEQVLEAADVVGRLLAGCPGLKVVATSRAPLHLRWEREVPVPPLSASSASHLFVERAHAVAPSFVLGDADAAAVTQICVQLDGLPLAIELAAARTKLFPPRALLRRLAGHDATTQESPLRLLADPARDLPPRQQTLLRAMSWSYDLLDEQEQAVFRRLSVFVGGCSVEAVEAVGAFDMNDGLEVVASLVDKNMIWREEQSDGEPRLRMLETIRTYGREQLAQSGETDAIQARHAGYYLDLAESAATQLVGPHQQAGFVRLERERDNLRAVESWAIARSDAEFVVRLCAALWPFWLAREDASQARDHLNVILPLLGQVPPGLALAGALHGAGLMAEKLGDYTTCRGLLERSLTVARQLGDLRTLATVLDSLGRQEFIEGRYAESRPLLEESHAILGELDDRVGLARVLSHLGFLEYLEGRPGPARTIFERGLAIAQGADDQHRVAEFMDNLGNTFEVEGDFDSATRMFEAAVAIWRTLGQGHWLAMALNNLGKVQTRRGELSAARSHLREALSLSNKMGNRRRLAYTLAAIAALAAAEGQTENAASLEAVAAAALAEIGAMHPGGRRQVWPLHSSARAAAPAQPITLDQAVEETLAWLVDQERRAEARSQVLLTQPTPPPQPRSDDLTRREREVVALLARGLTNRQIAEALVLTEGTAENYVQRVLGKLGFNNRVQVAAWAVEHGLGRRARPG